MDATTLDPRVSEFETQEQANSYDLWFRAKVQKSINNPAARIPHDEAMARLEQMLQEQRTQRAVG